MGWHIPDGATAEGPYRLVVTPKTAGWGYSGLRVLRLPPGGSHAFDTGEDEMLVLPLSGSCAVECDGAEFALAGRADVFAGPSDFAYLPVGSEVTVRCEVGGRFALPSARARRRLPARYGPAAAVPVELRGAGRASRQVHNFCAPEAFEADRLIAVEVLTPGGNWSSYPPHKHDEEHSGPDGDERELEEIYYFELSGGPGAVGYQRVYGSTVDRPIDVLAEVRGGDTVLVPYGYHGPSMAAPGYDLYYLNVMAGPGEVREWRFRDDPAHAWIRSGWAGEPVDPRLPFGRA
jgi:5-deoxy-glucuronate isomerase